MLLLALILQVLLALAFLFSGGRKLVGMQSSVVMRDILHIAPWFWSLTGVIEVLAGLGLLVGIWVAPLALLAALALAATMLGAVFTQVVNRQPFQKAVPGVVLLVLALVVVVVRWPDATHLFG